MKALKRQLDEAEEEISRERAQKRKTQRELEDSLQDNESKERELTNLKNKLRYVGREDFPVCCKSTSRQPLLLRPF